MENALAESKRLLTYSAAGAIGTVVHFAVLFATIRFAEPILASTLGAIAGCLVNYFLARHYVFSSSAPCSHSLPRFVAVATFGIALNAVVIMTFVEVLPIAINQAVASGTVLLMGYTLNKAWTFNDG